MSGAGGKIGHAGWYALALIAATQMINLLDRQILTILAPEIKTHFHIGDAELGLLYGTVFALFYALFSLPLGRLADGWSRTKLLAISIALWSLATGLGAFATGFAMLALTRLGVGVGEAAAQPAGTSLAYDYFPKPKRGMVMAALAAAIALGLGFSLVLGGVAAGWWNARYAGGGAPLGLAGWQFAFLVASAPGVILCTLLWRLQEPVRGSIDGLPAPNDPAPFRASLSLFGAVVPGGNWLAMIHAKAGARDWLGTVLYTGGVIALCALLAHICARFSPRPPLALFGGHINPHVLQWSVVGFGLLVIGNLVQSMKRTDPVMHMLLTRSRGLQLSVLVGSLQTLINYGVMGFTPSFLIRTFHLPPPVVGLHFGLLAAGLGVLGPLVAGPLSDRLAHNWSATGRVSLVLFSLSLSPLIAILVYQAPTIDAFYSRFVIYSLVLTMWLPPLYAVMYEQVLPRQRALFGSIYLVILTILGLGIGPYWVGMVADARHGELGGAILSVMWVAPVIVAALVWLLWAAPRDEALLLERARAAGEPV